MRPAVRRWRSALSVLCGAVLLAACASLPPPADGRFAVADWPQRRAELQRADAFEIKGRIAVVSGEEGFSAGVRWQQREHEALIELDGPFGVGGLRLQASGAALQLTTSRGERLDGEAARAELERRLGFALPLDALRFWVRGVPDPARAADERLAPDALRLAGLQQDGWQVDYAAYAVDPAGGSLPRRLSAAREGTRLRLVIENWSLQAPP